MVNFAEYHGGLGPPWQALRACSAWSPGVNGLLKYKSPYWANSCDHCHLVYRQASLARASHGGRMFRLIGVQSLLVFRSWELRRASFFPILCFHIMFRLFIV